jgi:hypothetical protein
MTDDNGGQPKRERKIPMVMLVHVPVDEAERMLTALKDDGQTTVTRDQVKLVRPKVGLLVLGRRMTDEDGDSNFKVEMHTTWGNDDTADVLYKMAREVDEDTAQGVASSFGRLLGLFSEARPNGTGGQPKRPEPGRRSAPESEQQAAAAH